MSSELRYKEAFEGETMRPARKLQSVAFADEPKLLQGRSVEGAVIGLAASGKAVFRHEDGAVSEVRVPRHVDQHWLRSAVALAPVPGIVAQPEGIQTPLLWCVFATPEHGVLDEHFRVEAKTVELSASESIQIRTGKAIITVNASGEIGVRGRNITSRASNLNRLRGGAIKLN